MDVFPANVTIASTTYNNVRAVLADGRLKIFTLTAGGVTTIYDMPSLAEPEGSAHLGVRLVTEHGQVWVENGGGCGCGSQLKIANLFPDQQRVMVPLHS